MGLSEFAEALEAERQKRREAVIDDAMSKAKRLFHICYGQEDPYAMHKAIESLPFEVLFEFARKKLEWRDVPTDDTPEIDAGEGYRLLEADEKVVYGDDCIDPKRPSDNWEQAWNWSVDGVQGPTLSYRRRTLMAEPPSEEAVPDGKECWCLLPDGMWFTRLGQDARSYFKGAKGPIAAWCHKLDGESEPPQHIKDTAERLLGERKAPITRPVTSKRLCGSDDCSERGECNAFDPEIECPLGDDTEDATVTLCRIIQDPEATTEEKIVAAETLRIAVDPDAEIEGSWDNTPEREANLGEKIVNGLQEFADAIQRPAAPEGFEFCDFYDGELFCWKGEQQWREATPNTKAHDKWFCRRTLPTEPPSEEAVPTDAECWVVLQSGLRQCYTGRKTRHEWGNVIAWCHRLTGEASMPQHIKEAAERLIGSPYVWIDDMKPEPKDDTPEPEPDIRFVDHGDGSYEAVNVGGPVLNDGSDTPNDELKKLKEQLTKDDTPEPEPVRRGWHPHCLCGAIEQAECACGIARKKQGRREWWLSGYTIYKARDYSKTEEYITHKSSDGPVHVREVLPSDDEREAELLKKIEALQAFKDYVHKRLDSFSVPENPDPEKTKDTGCRIGPRLDWLFSQYNQRVSKSDEREAVIAELVAAAGQVVTEEKTFIGPGEAYRFVSDETMSRLCDAFHNYKKNEASR